ncbi:hypothetical protein GCM10007382_09990 [Salinibacterium xinjiangense]|uniref:Large ribosomal subunit protein uL24 n=1 Tax=Salinibacterium xinjiangense TaxID=386302 RepID=A0A2C8Z7Y2_9MICO|nr:hypothetical protein GCM10007382_09990 [Salinibacterium xinjiangense]SOE60028.1 ribosomal protein L24 [Salinibacterium xinjiangense]
MANIHKGDLVQVISGPTQDRGGDRGKQGRVIGVIAGKNRVIVQGVNFVTKHVKVGQSQRGTKTGGIETMEAPIHVSNIALVDPETKLPARVGFTVETDDRGKTTRVRYFKKSRRVETKKSKALKGEAAEEKATEKPAKAAPKAKKDAAAEKPAATEQDAVAEKPAATEKDAN